MQGPQRGLRRHSGRQAVVDEGDVPAGELGKRPIAPVEGDSALQLAMGALGQHTEVVGADTEPAGGGGDDRFVEALGHRTDAQLFPARHANLAGDEHVERGAQRRRDLGGDGDAAPGQAKHHWRREPQRAQPLCQLPPSVGPVSEAHGLRVPSVALAYTTWHLLVGSEEEVLALVRLAVRWILVVGLLGSCALGNGRAVGLPNESGSPRAGPSTPALPEDRFRADRLAMVETQIAARGVHDPRVLDAMRTVPRHEFVPREETNRAYEDRPLPIGEGQTISQPYLVALMTELLDVQPGEKVLEIGTGSGYQAAVLAQLTDRVSTVEILPTLARRAASTLDRLGYARVQTKNADGYFGWAEHGPYDGIIVTAAPDHIPAPLVEQLSEGGRMVIPVGPPGSYQTLWRLTKQQGKVVSENITDVVFVPLVRKP
jgi:protein-L-isoaspartate(D-aspartate) O-methyltransferase